MADTVAPEGAMSLEQLLGGKPAASKAPAGAMSLDQLMTKPEPPPSGPAVRPSAPTAGPVPGTHLSPEEEKALDRVTTTTDHYGPDEQPKGIAHNVVERANRFFFNDLPGLPASMASAIMMAPKVWGEMRAEDQAKLREMYPNEQKFFDFLARAGAKGAEDFGPAAFRRGTDVLGVTRGTEPVTPGEKIAAAGTDVAAISLSVGLGEATAVGRAAQTVTQLDWTAGKMATDAVTKMAKDIAQGGAVGAAGEVAKEAVPERYKGAAELGGQVAGGVGAAVAGRVGGSGINFFTDLFKGRYSPEGRAATELLRAGGPTAREDVAAAAARPKSETGFEPSLYQATGNEGFGTLEADMRGGQGRKAFAGRDVEQNEALEEGLRGVIDRSASRSKAGVDSAVKTLGIDNPARFAKSVLDNPKALDDALGQLSPLGKEGLQRIVLDYMTRTGNVLKPGVLAGGSPESRIFSPKAFQTIMDNNGEALSKIFTPTQIENFGTVLGEAKMAMMKGEASVKTGSTYARAFLWEAAVAGGALGHALVGHLGGFLLGKAAGIAAEQSIEGAVAKRAQNMRGALTELLLNPELAKSMMDRIPDRMPREEVSKVIGQKLKEALASDVLQAPEGSGPLPIQKRELERPAEGVAGAAAGEGSASTLGDTYPRAEDTAIARAGDFPHEDRAGVTEPRAIPQVDEDLASYVVNKKKFGEVPAAPTNIADKNTSENLYRASLAARRNPVAALGYDPQRFVTTPPSESNFSKGGTYDPNSDMGWVDMNLPDGLIHESIHRGLEKMRRGGLIAKTPEEAAKTGMPYVSRREEETLVRAMMYKSFGMIEHGAGSINDRQVAEGRAALRNPQFAKTLERIELLAAREKARSAPYGGPR